MRRHDTAFKKTKAKTNKHEPLTSALRSGKSWSAGPLLLLHLQSRARAGAAGADRTRSEVLAD